MSGHLLQLARRGLGISHGVRSRATLPYATSSAATRFEADDFASGLSSERAPEPGPDLPQADSSNSPPALRTAPPAQAHSPAAFREANPTDVSSAPPTLFATHHAQRDALRQTPQEDADTPGPDAQELPRDRNVLRHPPADPRSVHATDGDGTAPAADSTPPPAPPEGARQTPPTQTGTRAQLDPLIDRLFTPAPQPPPRAREAAPTTGDDIAPQRPAPERATLMPARPAASVDHMAADAHARSAADAPDTPPEVHITIGRLEINPPPRPPPPPAPRPRGPAPLSLGDYLARRQGGRP